MTQYDIYVRLMTELGYYDNRSAAHARLRLQDVLCALRDNAAAERNDPTGQDTQDSAEEDALLARRNI